MKLVLPAIRVHQGQVVQPDGLEQLELSAVLDSVDHLGLPVLQVLRDSRAILEAEDLADPLACLVRLAPPVRWDLLEFAVPMDRLGLAVRKEQRDRSEVRELWARWVLSVLVDKRARPGHLVCLDCPVPRASRDLQAPPAIPEVVEQPERAGFQAPVVLPATRARAVIRASAGRLVLQGPAGWLDIPAHRDFGVPLARQVHQDQTVPPELTVLQVRRDYRDRVVPKE